MSRFSQPRRPAAPVLTRNVAGGVAFTASEKRELAAMVTTSFCEPEYYRPGLGAIERIIELVHRDPLYAAKTALAARNIFHMRTSSHVIAAEVATAIRGVGVSWGRKFFESVVFRPDDMMEIFAFYKLRNGADASMPSAMREGFRRAFDRFSDYQIAKYQHRDHDVKLIDIVNLTHPRPNSHNDDGLRELAAGTLRNTETWEARFSAAGPLNDEQRGALWFDLLRNGSLGYFAALRNLRNIEQTKYGPAIKAVADVIANPGASRRAKVLPFRLVTAAENISNPLLLSAIDSALTHSLGSFDLTGQNMLVALDGSGSMRGKPADIGAVFAVALAAKGADVMVFDTSAQYVHPMYGASFLGAVRELKRHVRWGGTSFPCVFAAATKKYDRIVFLSDMQGWAHGGAPIAGQQAYCNRTGANPLIFSWDLAHYGTGMFSEKRVVTLFGWSETALDLLPHFDERGDSIVKLIEGVQLG